MLLNDLRLAWRQLLRHPANSIVILLGLVAGFASCVLLLTLVRYSVGYNASVPDAGQILEVKQKRNLLPRPNWRRDGPLPLRDVALASGMATAATSAKQQDVAIKVDNRLVPLALYAADANYLEFFGIRALEGDATAALSQPEALVLSQDMAQKIFGTEHALGRTATIDGRQVEVRAIVRNQPANSSVQISALIGAIGQGKPKWNDVGTIYIKAAPANHASLTALLQAAVVEHHDKPLRARFKNVPANQNLTDIRTVNLNDYYFDADFDNGKASTNHASKASIMGLAGLAVLILLLATINYVSLAAVRTLARQREIGLRKALGVPAWRLVQQFLVESQLVTTLAAAFGVLVAWLAMPVVSSLVNRPLMDVFGIDTVAAAMGLAIVVGLLAGAYPARLALRLPVSETLHGRANTETSGGLWMRRVLSVFQFAAAMGLVGATITVGWQAHFAMHADPGFDSAAFLVVDLPGEVDSGPASDTFRSALARLPGVTAVAAQSEAVGRDGYKLISLVDRPGRKVPIELKRVSPEYFDTYRMKPVAGRLFDPAQDKADSRNVVINSSAALALGFASPQAAVGQIYADDYRIVGIAPLLRYQTMRQGAEAMVYVVDGKQTTLAVRTVGDIEAVRRAILELGVQHYRDQLIEVTTSNSILANNYQEDVRLAKILGAASIVAMALAAFGIYVLSAFIVRRRTLEIVLRKVHGAGLADIARLVASEFAALIALGAAVGLPLAAWACERYLSEFVERAPVGVWHLTGALVVTALVALVATTRHTRLAMRLSPAAVLRS